jgi:hypothetical protein
LARRAAAPFFASATKRQSKLYMHQRTALRNLSSWSSDIPLFSRAMARDDTVDLKVKPPLASCSSRAPCSSITGHICVDRGGVVPCGGDCHGDSKLFLHTCANLYLCLLNYWFHMWTNLYFHTTNFSLGHMLSQCFPESKVLLHTCTKLHTYLKV